MERFPALRGARFRGHYACAYDSTPDENFQIGPVPGASGVYFVGGMSGHGFKHAPSIGESVAALVSGAPQPIDLTPYALRAAGRPA
jgi:glycine/D-amino acid oxidase-like deaminating enzyme